MPNAKTAHSRALRAATARAWEAARKAKGCKRVCLLLSPAAAAKLDALAACHGSKSAAVEALLGDKLVASDNLPANR